MGLKAGGETEIKFNTKQIKRLAELFFTSKAYRGIDRTDLHPIVVFVNWIEKNGIKALQKDKKYYEDERKRGVMKMPSGKYVKLTYSQGLTKYLDKIYKGI
jgi:hypothetical protein